MNIAISAIIGYLFGCINPAAIISKIKHMQLRDKGTGNLGATNVTLVLGKRYGAVVMLFDIVKAFVSYHVARAIFSTSVYAGMIAGAFAVVGHCFPFFLRFRGGKGLAAFGGFVLAYDPLTFLTLLAIALVLVIIVNYSFVVPYFGSIFFPVCVYLKSSDWILCLIAALSGMLIMYKHFGNIIKAKESRDIKVRDFFKKVFKKKEQREIASSMTEPKE